jgi:hypothetical protein
MLQRQRRTASGWRHQSALMPLTVPRAWQEQGNFRCSSPQPSPTSSCTMSLLMMEQHSTSSALQLSRGCRSRCQSSSHHTHFLEWAQCRSCRVVTSPSRSHLGHMRTSPLRVFCLTSQRSASPSTPFWAGQPCTSLWRSRTMGT